MGPRFLAHQLIQGPSEAVGHLPPDPNHAEFFLLDTASPAACPVADAGEGPYALQHFSCCLVGFEALPDCVRVCPIFST